MEGTVRTVAKVDDNTWAVAVRWDDGTLSEDIYGLDQVIPEEGDRVERND